MKRFALYLLLCCCSKFLFSTTGNDPIKLLMNDFQSNDWSVVSLAKEKIENLGSAGIPELIAMMNECRVQKLQNTGDLIYPGAEKFFGHGQIIDYDIDELCVRAGWLLEDLTFKNFGFSGIHLPVDELSGFISTTFPEYGNSSEQQQTEALSEESKRELIRSLSIERTKKWWLGAAKQWNRLDALEQALSSNDEKCQVKALFYLRNGKTQCRGLNQKFYKSHFDKVIAKLTRSTTNRVSENAKLIMLDSDFDWLSLKPVN